MDISIIIGEDKMDSFTDIGDAIAYLKQVEDFRKATEQAKEAMSKIKEICDNYGECSQGCPFYRKVGTTLEECYFTLCDCPEVWDTSDLDTP